MWLKKGGIDVGAGNDDMQALGAAGEGKAGRVVVGDSKFVREGTCGAIEGEAVPAPLCGPETGGIGLRDIAAYAVVANDEIIGEVDENDVTVGRGGDDSSLSYGRH